MKEHVTLSVPEAKTLIPEVIINLREACAVLPAGSVSIKGNAAIAEPPCFWEVLTWP